MKKKIFILISIFLLIFSLTSCGKNEGSTTVNEVSSVTLKEQKACFNFFWETQVIDVNKKGYGLIPDRYPSNGLASIASVGFGLAGFCVGVQNGWISKSEGEARAILTLRAMAELDTIHGFYYHFYYEESGKPASGSEISNIDTAILVAGAIMAGEYFQGKTKELATAIYDKVEWPWYINPETNQFYMGYNPKTQKFEGAWDFYGEQLMMYFLAAGSSTFPIEKKVYDAFQKYLGKYEAENGEIYIFYNSWFGSIFTYQFSHAFVDFRNLMDPNGINWYDNSVTATLAHRQYCIDNSDVYMAYGENSLGITACDTPNGYNGYLGAAPSGKDNLAHQNEGTMSLAGSGGSMPFAPKEVEASLAYYYRILQGKLVGKYGLYDSYNITNGDVWIAPDVIGIDKGVVLLMIENYRSELVWKYFMQADFMDTAIEVLGFEEI